MNEAITAVLIIHALERLIAVCIGGLCVFLGWKLFNNNLDHGGEADVRHLGWRLTLKRIGPGVFFALFGATIVGTALTRPISADVKESWLNAYDDRSHPANQERASSLADREKQNGTQHVTESVFSGFGTGPSDAQRLAFVHALNSAIRVGTMNQNNKAIFNATFDDFKRGTKQLQRVRDSIVAQQFGKEAVDLWNEKGDKFQRDVNNLTKAEQEADLPTLNKVMPWMTDGMESESETAK